MSKLIWSNYEHGVAAWEDTDDEGALVGQDVKASDLSKRLAAARKKAQGGDLDARSEVEYLAVEIAAKDWALANAGCAEILSASIRVDGAGPAANYMRTIKTALRHAHDDTPWPEWALKAQAAGWKPPKGWKP